MKPSTAAIRANLTTRPITLRTTKTTTARMRATKISSVRMDLIRDFGDVGGHLGIANVHRAIVQLVERRLAGAALRALLAGGLGRSRGLLFGFLGFAHGQGNASGDKLCRAALQALHSAAGRQSLYWALVSWVRRSQRH